MYVEQRTDAVRLRELARKPYWVNCGCGQRLPCVGSIEAARLIELHRHGEHAPYAEPRERPR